ncbi:MAG: NAD(P)H-binding protein [Actinomycetota bacterium]|nr:NAD(P)H-binding protein [Actinomycetota bacterium]
MLLIAGSTGFVGGHLVSFLRQNGIPARCLVRNPGKTGPWAGMEIVRGDLNNIPEGALDGVDMVVHLVGIIREEHGQTFGSVHVKGTENLVMKALAAGTRLFFFQSALGAHRNPGLPYLDSKAQAEEIVQDSGLDYVIFRPSLILGPGDGFTEQMVQLIKSFPVLPVPGNGESRLQPIYINDWLKCFQKILEEKKAGVQKNEVVSLGGPEHLTFNRMLALYMDALGIHPKIIHIPMGMVRAGLGFFAAARLAGIKSLPPLTGEQLELLSMDNITSLSAVQDRFGFQPASPAGFIREFVG